MEALSRKQIIVPSFKTTAKIFNEHYLILKDLKHRIDLLKQAYFDQMEKKKTWEQVDEIIKVLKKGCDYLDFPIELDLRKNMVQDNGEHLDHATATLHASKLYLGRGGRMKIETGLGTSSPIKVSNVMTGVSSGDDNGEAKLTVLENIVEENAMEDVEDTSQEKGSRNPKTEDNGTNEMDMEMENVDMDDMPSELRTTQNFD